MSKKEDNSDNESDDEPQQYSLVPLDNKKTPNFNFRKTEVESAYFDQPNYESFDNKETSCIKFSEKGKQIAFKRRNSQENSIDKFYQKAEVSPKIEENQPNLPNEEQQIRKATKA